MNLTDHDKEILQAVIDGKDIVFNRTDRKNPEPASVFHIFAALSQGIDLNRYEVKPEAIMIGDMEVPKPINERPKDGFTAFYIVDIISPELGSKEFWVDSPLQQMALQRGLMQATHDGMIQHAKALIKISGGSYE